VRQERWSEDWRLGREVEQERGSGGEEWHEERRRWIG